jgi:hypothetical protein
MIMQKNLDTIPLEELILELKFRKDSSTKSSSLLSGFSDTQIFKSVAKRQQVIYGIDNRREIFHVLDSKARSNADSVAGIFDFKAIVPNGDGTSTLLVRPFREHHGVCPEEPFSNQPIGPICTAFLVAPDVVATAGHCINEDNFLTKRFVFNFQMLESNKVNLVIQDTDIFHIIEIIGRKFEVTGADYAIVKIDRPVVDRKILKLNTERKISDDEKLYVIGHPLGLPKKFADSAVVRDNTATTHFVSNLDTYGGNSGSPVFNATTHDVEGILVRGENDFVTINGCKRSLVCPTTGCRGEDVTRVSEFAGEILKVKRIDSAEGSAT